MMFKRAKRFVSVHLIGIQNLVSRGIQQVFPIWNFVAEDDDESLARLFESTSSNV